jgi:hypothetical protein
MLASSDTEVVVFPRETPLEDGILSVEITAEMADFDDFEDGDTDEFDEDDFDDDFDDDFEEESEEDYEEDGNGEFRTTGKGKSDDDAASVEEFEED